LVTDKWTEKNSRNVGFMNGEFDVLVATTIIESGFVANAMIFYQ
jgi:transcription-repair coupling factor (superfamily II helicase)